MEVHHHAHTSRKKWTHYFWEFLMLFLAVFCGFFAEYQLEHKIEKERVKKHMHDMIENLKYDTTRIGRNVFSNRETRADLDSFRFEVREAINGNPRINRLYYFYLKINQYGIVAFNKSTITQLKNSGTLRLVKNDSLLNEILDYYERKVMGSELYQVVAQKSFESFTQKTNSIFSTTTFDFIQTVSDKSWNDDSDESFVKSLNAVLQSDSLKLLETDRLSLETLHTEALQFEWSLINYNRFLNYAREGAQKLMLDIKEIY